MCCFSQKVDVVADTNIFARASKDGRQFLVYSMRFAAAQDLAMILPIPTPKDSPEDAVRQIRESKIRFTLLAGLGEWATAAYGVQGLAPALPRRMKMWRRTPAPAPCRAAAHAPDVAPATPPLRSPSESAPPASWRATWR